MNLRSREPLIFDRSVPGKIGMDLPLLDVPPAENNLAPHLRRQGFDALPSCSEPEIIRHFTRLSLWNYGMDQGMYPLGSCTMKHNPRLNEATAALPGFAEAHPMADEAYVQGNLELLYTLQEWLKEVTGLDAVTLQPSAGAAGELTGVLLIRAYHVSRNDKRKYILVPDSAHGTNPATAVMAGYEVIDIPSGPDGCVSFDDCTDPTTGKTKLGFRSVIAAHGKTIAGLMITNPNTCGIFESRIGDICSEIHRVGGMVYMDGANMNALVGIARPKDFGIDVMHMNLHKTMSTPHGGGGPGAGPVACVKALEPFLPRPIVVRSTEKIGEGEVPHHSYRWDWDRPQSIGKVHTFFGNFGMLVRALTYCFSHGSDGLREATLRAIVNANYVRSQLIGTYHLPITSPTMHEVVFNDSLQAKHGIHTLDIAKRLIDYGFHPPTIYFPMVVSGALMIEPTETESKEEMDVFIYAMKQIARESIESPQLVHDAPTLAPLRRLDEATAARKPVLRWSKSV